MDRIMGEERNSLFFFNFFFFFCIFADDSEILLYLLLLEKLGKNHREGWLFHFLCIYIPKLSLSLFYFLIIIDVRIFEFVEFLIFLLLLLGDRKSVV